MSDAVQKYTDLTYGFLLLVGMIAMYAFDVPELAFLGIGIFIGYVVHVGSEMVEFSRVQESVEETREVTESAKETVESVEQKVDSIEEKTEQAAEKAEAATDTAEETKEAVEKVDEKTTRVEGAVNGGPE